MSHRMTIRYVLLALAFLAAPLGAQDALLRAKERAQLLTDFRAMLEHTDASTRMAAFEEAAASKDQALITMAMDAAFGGNDPNLKTAALRYYLNGRKTLPITVILPDRASDGLAAFHTQFIGLAISRIAVTGSDITATGSNHQPVAGQLVSGGIELRLIGYAAGCTLSARLVGAKQMAGSVDCSIQDRTALKTYGSSRATFPVRIDLP